MVNSQTFVALVGDPLADGRTANVHVNIPHKLGDVVPANAGEVKALAIVWLEKALATLR